MELLEKTLKDRVVGGNPNLTSKMVMHVILHTPLRQHFIERVKAPLLEAIVSLANKYPEPTKDNLQHPISLALLGIMCKFCSYEDNPGREGLFRAVGRLLIDEVEHDAYYRDRFQFILEEIIKSILDGNWSARGKDKPSACWKEPRPHGGVHSIIAKMIGHREEICRLLR